MRAEELIKRYTTERHVENGVFVERHYVSEKEGRADSGSIFYYVAPGERTEFHRIDCDEYWCHNAGEDIEIWSFSKGGELKKLLLGTSENASPFVFFKSGEIFASRMKKESRDGAFVTCITVPRFTYDGFEMFGKEKMISLYPESKGFWDEI
ncbi:MAG: cupin domain-containing protein [Clostridiales bacterium]|nr:cupin domain-containing protein [Candidatus Coliplasma equi]